MDILLIGIYFGATVNEAEIIVRINKGKWDEGQYIHTIKKSDTITYQTRSLPNPEPIFTASTIAMDETKIISIFEQ